MPDTSSPSGTAERDIVLFVNEETRTTRVEPRMLLVHALRDGLHLTGAHIACDTSQCGACTVLLDGKSVKSCTIFAVQAEGHRITTIEGLGNRAAMHPVQEAFWLKHGLQCGFCTPGMIVAAVALLDRTPDPTDEQIRKGLDGNICRCTGYENIVRAIQSAGAALREGRPRRSAAEIFPPEGPPEGLDHVAPEGVH